MIRVWELIAEVKGLSLSDLMDLKLLTWNVRGLGNMDKRVAICKDFNGVFSDILVLQETKVEAMSDQFVREIWGKPSKYWLALPS